jgi:hypothetical protein
MFLLLDGNLRLSTITTIQQSGNRVGMFASTSPGSSPTGNAQTIPVCLTEPLIDTYGIALPPSLRDCEISNVQRKPDSITADMTCKGRYSGKGSIESTWSDDEHGTGKVHFIGKMKEGSNLLTMGWTQSSTAVFKSQDCGSIKPRTLPAK